MGQLVRPGGRGVGGAGEQGGGEAGGLKEVQHLITKITDTRGEELKQSAKSEHQNHRYQGGGAQKSAKSEHQNHRY